MVLLGYILEELCHWKVSFGVWEVPKGRSESLYSCCLWIPDVEFSAAPQVPCLPVCPNGSCCDSNELNLWNWKPTLVKCFISYELPMPRCLFTSMWNWNNCLIKRFPRGSCVWILGHQQGVLIGDIVGLWQTRAYLAVQATRLVWNVTAGSASW